MAKSEQELEVKFFMQDLGAFARRLEKVGAQLTQPRVFEANLRFDTKDGALSAQHQVLRLRQDTAAVLTYKGAPQEGAEVNARVEIEFQVSDFESARHLLEALGYRVSIIYEKYRTTYHLGELMITLDEMPFGDFVEIEGPDAESIEKAAALLKLEWKNRGITSYLALFALFCAARGISAQNLTFDEVKGPKAEPAEVGMQYAD